MSPPSRQPRPAVADVRLDIGARYEPETRPRARARSALMDRAFFLRGFLLHPAQVGSVVPSSRRLEQRIARRASAGRTGTVVELGPGTGGTTRALLNAMPADARLLAIDLSPDFCHRLVKTIRDSRLTVQCGSAAHVMDFLDALNVRQADVIVSGIPFSTMPADVADQVARAIATALAPGGRFIAYQVRAHVADYVSPYLGAPTHEWELLNVPPMRVFCWTRPR